jgi:hypothetical protein
MPNTIRYSASAEYIFYFYDNYFLFGTSKVGFVSTLTASQPLLSVGQSIIVDQTSDTPTNPSYDGLTTITGITHSNVYGDGLRWIIQTDINYGVSSPVEGGSISLSTDWTVNDTLSLKKGNLFIGVGDVSKGTTEDTGHWNGITPPKGGYTIYLGGIENGPPSIYIAYSDIELVSLTNLISGTTYRSKEQCFSWFATQLDKMVVDKDYESIVTNGLVLSLDAGFIPSHPRSGTTWYDVSTYTNNKNRFSNGTLYNGPAFSIGKNGNSKSINFDGTNDYCRLGSIDSSYNNFSNFSFSFWFSPTSTIAPGKLSTFSMMMEAQDTRLASATPDNYVYFLTNGQLVFATYTPTQNLIATSTTWVANTWYHLTCTYESSTGTKKMYINGALENSVSSVFNNYFNTYSQFGLGMYDGGVSNGFAGRINGYLLYFRTLSETEVSQNYDVTKARHV